MFDYVNTGPATRCLRGRDRDKAVTMRRELAGIPVYCRRLAEFQVVKILDKGKMSISSRLLPHDATVEYFEAWVLSRVTKVMFCAGAREHRVRHVRFIFATRAFYLSARTPTLGLWMLVELDAGNGPFRSRPDLAISG